MASPDPVVLPPRAILARQEARAVREELERRRRLEEESTQPALVDPRDAAYKLVVLQIKQAVRQAIDHGLPKITVIFERLEWMRDNLHPTPQDAREYFLFRLQTESLIGYCVDITLHETQDEDLYVYVDQFHVHVRWE